MSWLSLDDLFSNALTGAIGFVLGLASRRIRDWWSLVTARARYQFLRDHDRGNDEVALLDSAIPEFIVDQNSLVESGHKFFLHPSPNFDFKSVNRTIGPAHKGQHFHTGKDVFFGAGNTIDYLVATTGVPDLASRIDAAREVESDLFFRKVQGRSFNSQKIGVRQINFSRRGDDEQSRLDLSVYITDFFTHQVMQRVVHQLMAEKVIDVDAISNDVSLLNSRYFPFMTSFGLNVFLLTDFNKKIILTKRSRNIAQQGAANRVHVTMNEGFSSTDFDKRRTGVGGITVDNCYRRGMREELGFEEVERRLSDVHVYDLFMAKKIFQLGIFAWASFDGVSEKVRNLRAQDKMLEVAEMITYDFNSDTMNDLLEQDVFTSYARVGLRNLCLVRGLQTAEFRMRGARYYRALMFVLLESLKRSMSR